LLAILPVVGLVSFLAGFFLASAGASKPSETAHPIKAALDDPNIVQDFLALLHHSDPTAHLHGPVTVLRRSSISLCHVNFECERADAA
jgi:hypothetical protein